MQEDINRVIEEGDLQVKLEELDRLEEQAKETPGPAWYIYYIHWLRP